MPKTRALVIVRMPEYIPALEIFFPPEHYLIVSPGAALPEGHQHNRVILLPGWKGEGDTTVRDAWAWWRSTVEPAWSDRINRQTVAL